MQWSFQLMLGNNNPARTRKVSIWNMWNVELTKKCIMAWIFALLLEYHGAESGWTWQESHLERVWYRQQTMSCLQIRKEGTSCREVDARSHARPKKPGDLWWFRDFNIQLSYVILSFFYAVPVVLSTRGICVVHQLLKSRKGSRPCCNAALSLSPTRAKPFSIWSEMSIQF